MTRKHAAPFWSVVIPLYNKQEFIEATLRSVLDQADQEDLEVVVVDDGSRDEGAARVAALADPRVRLIRQANSGVAAARNRGVRESRGRWVAFLDADDLWHPEALSSYRKIAVAFPLAEAMAGAYVRVSSVDVPSYRFAPHVASTSVRQISNLPSELLTRGMPFCTCSIAIRRDRLTQLEPWFPEGESMGEDIDLWLRLVEQTEVAYTSNVLVLYRTELSNSLMGQYKDLALLPVWQRLRYRARSAAIPSSLRKASLRLVAEMEITLARRVAKAGRRSEALRHLYAARVAAKGHRWWVTLLALAFCSGRQIQRLR